MRETLGKRMRKRGGKQEHNNFVHEMRKSPLKPNVAHTSIRGEWQYFRPNHDRVWRRSVQVSVTEIVGIL